MAVEASARTDAATGVHVVCGLGHVGYRVALLLRRLGRPVSVIYNHASADWLADLEAAGAVSVHGDATDDRVLERAGVRAAQAVIAVTDQDLANLSVALDAKRLHPGVVTVVRLHDRALARHVEEGLGVRQVLSTSALAAPAFIAAALAREDVGYLTLEGAPYALVETSAEEARADPSALPVLTLTPNDAAPPADDGAAGEAPTLALRPAGGADPSSPRRLRRARVSPWSALVGFARQAPRRAVGLVLLALVALLFVSVETIHRTMDLGRLDALYFAITTVTSVGYGDFSFRDAQAGVKLFGCALMLAGAVLLAALVGLVTDALVSYRLRDLLVRQPSRKSGHAIVIGGGHIGSRTVEQLAADGCEVVCLCPESETLSVGSSDRVQVIQGDGRSDADLRLAGVERAGALLAVREDDVANLSVALQARKLRPEIITVVRVFDGSLAEKLQRELNVDAVLSVSAASAPAFVAAALFEEVLLAAVWRDHLVVIRAADARAKGARTLRVPHNGATTSVRVEALPLAPLRVEPAVPPEEAARPSAS